MTRCIRYASFALDIIAMWGASDVVHPQRTNHHHAINLTSFVGLRVFATNGDRWIEFLTAGCHLPPLTIMSLVSCFFARWVLSELPKSSSSWVSSSSSSWSKRKDHSQEICLSSTPSRSSGRASPRRPSSESAQLSSTMAAPRRWESWLWWSTRRLGTNPTSSTTSSERRTAGPELQPDISTLYLGEVVLMDGHACLPPDSVLNARFCCVFLCSGHSHMDHNFSWCYSRCVQWKWPISFQILPCVASGTLYGCSPGGERSSSAIFFSWIGWDPFLSAQQYPH